MKRTSIYVTVVGVLCGAGTGELLAGDGDDETRPVKYRLVEESTYQEGCFPPCLCPLMMEISLTGSFTLLAIQPYPPVQIFEVSDVDWSVPLLGLRITGQGTYTVHSEFAVMQRLELDLQMDDDPLTDARWS